MGNSTTEKELKNVMSDKLLWQQARDDAAMVLECVQHADGSIDFPVTFQPILDYYDLTVEEKDLKDGTSGYIHKPTKDSRPKIVLNENESHLRQRFTLAHEIGHYIERTATHDEEYTFIEKRGAKYDLLEFYADEFAGELLMPEKEILRLLRAGKNEVTLAKHFGVTVSAVVKRCERLLKTGAYLRSKNRDS